MRGKKRRKEKSCVTDDLIPEKETSTAGFEPAGQIQQISSLSPCRQSYMKE